MKRCSKCGETKEPQAFSVNRALKSGLNSSCKLCANKRVRDYRSNNKQHMKAIDSASYLRHRQSKVEGKRAYRKTEAGRLTQMRGDAVRAKRHPEKGRARHLLGSQLRNGNMARDTVCLCCGRRDPNGVALHAHHMDYSKPLEVMWLREDCHRLLHRRLEEFALGVEHSVAITMSAANCMVAV